MKTPPRGRVSVCAIAAISSAFDGARSRVLQGRAFSPFVTRQAARVIIARCRFGRDDMANKHTQVGIRNGRKPEPPQQPLPGRPTMPRPSMLLSGICLALLSSCAPTPAKPLIGEPPTKAAGPPIGEPPAKVTSEEATERLTLAERAARYDKNILPEQPTTEASSTAPAGRDYQNGYPHLARAPKARADGSLQSFLALDTGPYLANHDIHNLIWTNNSGRTLAIYKTYLWTGFDKGGIADVHIEAHRGSDNSYIGILQWDHYADPTSPQHGQQFDYPSPMMLDPGDTITIMHFANGFTPGWHAHHWLILWVK